MKTYIEVEPGVELYVEDHGSGDVLVFIPGFTFTTEVFSRQVDHFCKTHRTIVIDPRSHGRSTMTVHGNDYATHGADLQKVLQALKIENPILIGWSFGCLTVWEYIRQFGTDDMKGQVLIDMPPKSLSHNENQDWVEGKLDDMAAAYTNYLRNPKGQRDFISAYANSVMVQRDLTEEELSWLVEQSLTTPYYIAANLFSSGLFSDYREEAASGSQQIPTLYVVAEHWSSTARPYLNKLAPQAAVDVLGGHMMFWEHHERFHTLMEAFLAKQT
ncbi:alpha/beta hydrolase [Halobacillus sp. Cin3]|uniref:alpha/beta fold hydrolase n=1 Tax=Halobacillus sp. Cin3 TaxID=2928441 RepID=UPI00248E1A6E|nr:alpha/beta hydrolase [Halobacillus sp. Cin3]